MSLLIHVVIFLVGCVTGALFGVRNVGRVELAKEAVSEFLDKEYQDILSKTDIDEKARAKYAELKAKLEKLHKRLEGLGF